jgi:streptogramin lyase
MKTKSTLFAALAAATTLWAMPATAGEILVTNTATGTVGEHTNAGAVVNAALVSGLSGPEGIAVVPEPSTWAMLTTGAGVLLVFPRRKSKAARLNKITTGAF